MSRFLIAHPDGREFELTDLDYFRTEYAPQGFSIVVNPPHGYDVPQAEKPKAKFEAPKIEAKDVKKP